MKEGDPLVFGGCEVDWTDSEWDEVSHQPRGRDTRCNHHHPPDNEEFATLQFDAGFQAFQEHIDTQDKDQHDEDNGDRQVVSGKIGATDVEIVIRSGEALADHASHTDEHTPQCESSMSEVGGL